MPHSNGNNCRQQEVIVTLTLEVQHDRRVTLSVLEYQLRAAVGMIQHSAAVKGRLNC